MFLHALCCVLHVGFVLGTITWPDPRSFKAHLDPVNGRQIDFSWPVQELAPQDNVKAFEVKLIALPEGKRLNDWSTSHGSTSGNVRYYGQEHFKKVLVSARIRTAFNPNWTSVNRTLWTGGKC